MRVETNFILDSPEPFSTPARLTASAEPPQDVTVIHLTGPLTAEEPVQFFLSQIRDLLERGRLNLLIDLADVPFIDSTGLGGLAAAYNAARDARAHIKFLTPSRLVLRGLHRVHLDRVFELYESEEQALASF